MSRTKADLEKEVGLLTAELFELREKVIQLRSFQTDYNEVTKKITTLRLTLEEEFKAFIECHFLNHAERRGAERYFAARINRALFDVLPERIPF